jgi:hypothetical protein
MGIQSGGSPNFKYFENFGTFDLGVFGKMSFGCSPMLNHKKYYKGEGGGFPKFRLWWDL